MNPWLVSLALFIGTLSTQGDSEIIRARDLGIPFKGIPGEWNSITDVKGVEVGHSTVIRGNGDLVVGRGPVRTGVTAILPSGKNWRPVFAAVSTLNANGEMTGTEWIEESGFLEEPILLTNTHSVGAVHQASIAWRQERAYHSENAGYAWASLPVVAETWDGRLNDIHGFHVKKTHVFHALDSAATGPVPEGNVGGGTGMVCFRFKGGIGTASRILANGFKVGTLVQTNFGLRKDLIISGQRVGEMISDLQPVMHGIQPPGAGHSIIVVIATDAPLLPHQLKRVAKRAGIGVGRVGGIGRHSSGDLFLAFSTVEVSVPDEKGVRRTLMMDNETIDLFFEAVVQSVEEAIVNAMVAAETMEGINGNTIYALPHERVRALFTSDRAEPRNKSLH